MWSSITNIAKNAASFLSSNRVPPGTPIELQDSLRSQNHFKSKKFFLAFSSFIGLLFFYVISVAVLFILPPKNELIAGYVTIFTKTVEIVAIIVASYIGVQAVVDLKYNSDSSTSFESVLTSEQREEKIIQETTIRYAEKYKNDPSYAPIEWVFNQEGNQE
jgi:hypothetical protein